MFTGRYIASSPKHPWVPPTPPDLHCHHILIRRKGVEWSSQPPESRMVATSLTFLLLLLLHLASPAPAPTAEVKEVHSPALGEVVQVCKTIISSPPNLLRWCRLQRRLEAKARQSEPLFSSTRSCLPCKR